jgi:DnaA family protein
MQLPLAIQISESASFENFLCPDDAFLIASLEKLAVEDSHTVMYLWGASGSGKTHLLQAVCRQASQANELASYLPLAELISHPTAMLEGMENIPVICIDDLQCLQGHADWETALFNLFNRVFEQGGRMLFAATASPAELGLGLADLVSRLQSGPVFQVSVLADEQKIEALKLRARQRGLILDNEPAKYLLNRFPRDLNALFEVLDKLDQESLIKQRRITIPFIREVFTDNGN